jgi:hypothetical protein
MRIGTAPFTYTPRVHLPVLLVSLLGNYGKLYLTVLRSVHNGGENSEAGKTGTTLYLERFYLLRYNAG